jgi:hypothetical protein
MKRHICISILVLFTLIVQAQVKQEVIASAGGYNTSGGLSISWTLGEVIIPTFKNGDLVLTHGFQQKLIITVIEENLDILIDVKVFPNPASEVVYIRFESTVNGEIDVNILDSQGKLVKTDKIESTMTEKQINLQEMPAGIYYLRLTKGKLLNVYKVVKL